MLAAWERLQTVGRPGPADPEPPTVLEPGPQPAPPALPLHGRTVGELEELFRRRVRELSPAELEELFGYLAPQVQQLDITVGRAISWARARAHSEA